MPLSPNRHTQTMLGETIIHVSDQQLLEGYHAGNLSFRLKYRGRPISEQEVYHELMQLFCSSQLSDRWKAGYFLGWAMSLHEPFACSQPQKVEAQQT